MRQHLAWTEQEIDYMKYAFLSGRTIKAIARELGRTPTALNKALSRFGIRLRRKPIIIRKWLQRFEERTKALFDEAPAVLKRDQKLVPLIDHYLEKHRQKYQDPQKWVAFDQVVNYLRLHGLQIIMLGIPKQGALSSLDTMSFECDGKIISAVGLLLMANRQRLDENKPIFMVSDLTW